jgi:hypothetical protein
MNVGKMHDAHSVELFRQAFQMMSIFSSDSELASAIA